MNLEWCLVQQAEDVMLQPAKAKIVLRERRKKQHSKQHVLFYEVTFHNHPREEGSWWVA